MPAQNVNEQFADAMASTGTKYQKVVGVAGHSTQLGPDNTVVEAVCPLSTGVETIVLDTPAKCDGRIYVILVPSAGGTNMTITVSAVGVGNITGVGKGAGDYVALLAVGDLNTFIVLSKVVTA